MSAWGDGEDETDISIPPDLMDVYPPRILKLIYSECKPDEADLRPQASSLTTTNL
jgi:hypothetical protein